MFTGIIEELGQVISVSGSTITIKCSKVLENTQIGDSIAVNGCCQTVVTINKDSFSANVSQETFNVTNFKELKTGDTVNLERAMILSSRLGGHIVSGHVDGIAKLAKIENLGEFYNLTFQFPEEFRKYVIKKGSVTLNGISLTVANVMENRVVCAIIPHTYQNTNLHLLKIQESVNIEFDLIAKYVENFVSKNDNNGISFDFLSENGFV